MNIQFPQEAGKFLCGCERLASQEGLSIMELRCLFLAPSSKIYRKGTGRNSVQIFCTNSPRI
jgi:hypothetical protein